MKYGTMETGNREIVVTKVFYRTAVGENGGNIQSRIGIKEVNGLIASLVARRWRLVFTFFCQLLLQAAFAVAVHLWLIPVFTKVARYVVLVGIILRHDHQLVKRL
jgi:hypothetical protein